MDEAEEEALFARLRASLAELRRDAAAAASQDAGRPESMAALTRLESSLRTLASGLDTLAQRTDALDSGIEARVEEAVARNTAALRLDLNRLEARFASAHSLTPPPVATGAAEPPRDRAGSRLGLLALAVMVLAAIGAGAVAFIRSPQTDNMRQLASDRLREFRTMLSGEQPATQQAAAPQQAQAQPSSPAPSSGPKPVANPGEAATRPPNGVSLAASQQAPGASSPVAPTASASTVPSAAKPERIVIRATSPAWVEVRERSGNVLFRRTMHPGEVWETPGQPDLLLSTGNAPGLVLDVNGKPHPLPGGRVVRDMSLP